jgi:hypothetical protein
MKYSSLSANTLFHFTSQLDNLINILINEFHPHYCLEDWEAIIGSRYEIAIPMVCFCEIQNHTKIYGNYAIGLSKEWGRKHKIAPVLYTYNGSATANYLLEIRQHFMDNSSLKDTLVGKSYEKLVQFSKSYEGKLRRNGKSKGTVRFYDEREWRFVPKTLKGYDKRNYLPLMEKKSYMNTAMRSLYDSLVKKIKLSFEPKDIKYIIVAKKSEILDMAHKVEEIKSKYSPNDKKLLTTKIISMEQIRDDF